MGDRCGGWVTGVDGGGQVWMVCDRCGWWVTGVDGG